MLTSDDIRKLIEVFATKEDLKEAVKDLSTKKDVNDLLNAVDAYAKREDDYFAFSKDGKETIFLNGLKALVHQMQGTDILIYKI